MHSTLCLQIPIIHSEDFLKIASHITIAKLKEIAGDKFKIHIPYVYEDTHDVYSYKDNIHLQPKVNIPCKYNERYFDVEAFYDDINDIQNAMKAHPIIKGELLGTIFPRLHNCHYEYNVITIAINYGKKQSSLMINTRDNFFIDLMQVFTKNCVHPQFGNYIFTDENGKILISYDDFKFIDDKYTYMINIEEREIVKDDVIFIIDNLTLRGSPQDKFPSCVIGYFDNDLINYTFRAMTTEIVNDLFMFRIYITTITRKKIPIIVHEDMTIGELMDLIQNVEGIPPSQQILTYGKMCLENKLSTISECKIQRNSKILLTLLLRGGGTFVNVEHRLVSGEWSSSAPQWRVCNNGINFETGCTNNYCVASNMRVIQPHGYGSFNMLNKNMQCPMCNMDLLAVNFVVTKADLVIIGKKKNGQYINKSITVNEDPYYPPTNAQEEYEYLYAHCTHSNTNPVCKLCNKIGINKKFPNM